MAPAADGLHDLSGDEAVAELAALREATAWEDSAEEFFYTRPLGGRWLRRNKGLDFDSHGVFARACVRGWCARFDWPTQRTF